MHMDLMCDNNPLSTFDQAKIDTKSLLGAPLNKKQLAFCKLIGQLNIEASCLPWVVSLLLLMVRQYLQWYMYILLDNTI